MTVEDEIKVIESHLGQVVEVNIGTVDNPEIIKMSPLSPGKLSQIYRLAKLLKGAHSDPAMVPLNVDEALLNNGAKLIVESMKPHYSSLSDEKLDEFARRNILLLIPGLWEANMGISADPRELKRLKAIDRIKTRIEVAKHAQSI